MPKQVERNIVGIKPSTVALFQATFAAATGLSIAVLRGLDDTVHFTSETNNVLAGMSFGVGNGMALILTLPLIYFALGWIVGYLNGFVLNAVMRTSGGVVVMTEK
ncbi:MAG TPA: hypothetical protein VL362_02310 [Patescibacteria group bacterium]|jgi:hypothetical protein|nr:hypothetical protein [Patescibacteria group bacterium]